MNVYVINSDSYLLINEKINEIIKNSQNITTFDLNINSLEEVIIEANYFSMFDEVKYIIVKNANFFGTDKIKDKDNDLLIKYLENPSNKTVIIFVSASKLDMRKKITKIVKDKYSLIVIPNLKPYEIENRLKNYFLKENYKVTDDTLKYIVSNSLNNYDIVMGEALKIVLYYNEPTLIKYNDVVSIVAKSLNTNNFLFVDAVVNNDLEKSLSLYQDLKVMKVEPTVLISLLARDFRIMFNIKNMQKEGIQEYEIMNNLGLADWQFNKYLNKVFPYKIKELESILTKLANLDLDIKRGKIDRFIGLELFILDMCS